MKKGITVDMTHDSSGHLMYVVRKARGELTLEEIKDAMTEYEQDYYGLVLKCMGDDVSQYFDDDLQGDVAELYPIEDVLKAWDRVKET